MILGSDRPLTYDRAWIGRLLTLGTGLGELSREWLGIDSVGDHFGRHLLDENGVAQLAERGTLTHRDDRPELEFVAARRFLDPEWDSHVFDSLMALEVRVGGHPGTSPVLLARAMTAPRVPSTVGPILMAAHRAQPDNPVWLVRVARSEEHTSELQSRLHLVCRLLLEKKKKKAIAAWRGPLVRVPDFQTRVVCAEV